MTLTEKIEKFLMEMDTNYDLISENTWLVDDENDGINGIIIRYEDPVILFRVKAMSLPKSNKETFLTKILELNATDMLYGAYALEGDNVVIINTLAAENLDFNEFQSTIESISLSLIEHYKVLQQFIEKGEK